MMPYFVSRRSSTDFNARSASLLCDADSGEDAEALRFDENLPFLTLFGADFSETVHRKRG